MVTRCAVTRHAPAVDRYAVGDRCAVADHSAAVVGRDAAADRCGVVLHTGAFRGVAQVETHAAPTVAPDVVQSVAPNVVQSVAPNAVRKSSLDDLIESRVALAVVPVRDVARVVTQVSAYWVVQCEVHCAARDYCAAGSRLPAGRASVSPLRPASLVAHEPAALDCLQAVLTLTVAVD